jgi:hypothetical protein
MTKRSARTKGRRQGGANADGIASEPCGPSMPDPRDLPPRQGGALKGKIWVADNFDEFDEELDELFYGPKGCDEQ